MKNKYAKYTADCRMTRFHAYYLILRYPSIAKYIEDCYNNKKNDELLDFLANIEYQHDQQKDH